jgi:arylsulfatase
MHGISMRYTFDNPCAATRRETQYFELLGDRAIWHQGWKAVTRHRKGSPIDQDPWELYHLDKDFSETRNLAQSEPGRLSALIERWLAEATKYSVLPLDDREWERAAERMRRRSRAHYDYFPGMARIDRLMAPDITGRGFRIEARLMLTAASRREGVMLAWGSRLGGLVLYMRSGMIVLEYVYSQDLRVQVAVPDRLPRGEAMVVASFKKRRGDGGLDLELGGTGLDSRASHIPKAWPTHGMTAGISCGQDAGRPVSGAYSAPFPMDATLLQRVTVIVQDTGAAADRIWPEQSVFLED